MLALSCYHDQEHYTIAVGLMCPGNSLIPYDIGLVMGTILQYQLTSLLLRGSLASIGRCSIVQLWQGTQAASFACICELAQEL